MGKIQIFLITTYLILLLSFTSALYPYISPLDLKDLNSQIYGQAFSPIPQTYSSNPNKEISISSINQVFPTFRNIDLTSDGNIIITPDKKNSQIQLGLRTLNFADLNIIDLNANYDARYVKKTGDTMTGDLGTTSVFINPRGTTTASDITAVLNATDDGYSTSQYGALFYDNAVGVGDVHSEVALVERGLGNSITAVGNVSIEGVNATGSPLGQIAALTIVQSTADYGIHLTGDATIVGVTTGTNFVSTVAIGTQPYATTSTTLNTNLNVDLLDGKHASEFLLLSGDTMTGDLLLTSAISEKPILTLQNTTLGGDTPYFNITNVNGTLSLYLNSDGTGVIDGGSGSPLYLGSPSEFSSGGGDTSDLGSLTDKWRDLFLSGDIQTTGNIKMGNTGATASMLKIWNENESEGEAVSIWSNTFRQLTIDSDLITSIGAINPSADDNVKLGAPSLRWEELYIANGISDGTYWIHPPWYSTSSHWTFNNAGIKATLDINSGKDVNGLRLTSKSGLFCSGDANCVSLSDLNARISLASVSSTTDTNWQTNFPVFDSNLQKYYYRQSDLNNNNLFQKKADVNSQYYSQLDANNVFLKLTGGKITGDLNIANHGALFVDENITMKRIFDSSLMGWYRFQVDGTDYSYLLRNLTGGTYTSGFLTGGATGNSYASLYNAEANVTVVSKFKIDDPTQSGSTVFELYKNTGHLGATNTAWYLGANNDRFTGVYDQMVFLIENNGTPIVAWNSGGNYNDKVWHSIEVTCGAGGSVFRIDGAIVTGTYATGNASTACGFNAITSPDRIQIGNTNASIADMKIFNRVLTTRETLKEYDEMLLNPFYSSLSNLGAIGFNGATNANYFMELTYSALDVPGRPKGILHYANPQEGSNGGSQVFFDLSTYRMDFSGNIYYKGVMTDGAGGNYPAYFSNINDSSESTWNNSALYLSANNAGGTGQELAAYAARGNYFAVDNYGLLLGTGFDAKIVYDGTNLVINPKLVGTGSTIILGDLNTTKDINASGVFWSGKARGINRTITYMASAIISCQMDINGGIITKITGAGC